MRIHSLIAASAITWTSISVWDGAGTAAAAEPAAAAFSTFDAMRWRNLGPFRGGRASAATGVPQDINVYYLGTAGGGLYKTTNAGTTWVNVSDGFVKTGSVGAVAVAPSDPNIVYLGMGESSTRFNTWHHGDGVYKSTDAGKTWQHIGLTASQTIGEIRIHPTNPDLVYVAAQGALYGPTKERGVYRSSDGGKTWQQVLFVSPTAGAADLCIDPNNPDIIYAATWDHQRFPWEIREVGPDNAIYKTTDGGDTWQKIGTGLPKVRGKIAVVVAANSTRLYASVATDVPNDSEAGMYRSDDSGATWTLVNDSPDMVTRSAYYGQVVADPKNPDIVWLVENEDFVSTDGGKTFTEVESPHGDQHDLWINPDNSQIMIGADDGGGAVSFDGGKTWSTQFNQPTGQFYRINADNRFPYWVYSAQQDSTTVGIATMGGISRHDWMPVGGGESAFIDFDPNNPELIYASNVMGRVNEFTLSTRLTRDISPYPIGPNGARAADHKYRLNWSIPIVVSRHDPKNIYLGAQKLLRSSNRGSTWIDISPDLTRLGENPRDPDRSGKFEIPYGTIIYVAESPHDAKVLWTGSDDGIIGITQDGGQTWRQATLPIGEARINAIEFSPHDPAVAYVAATRFEFDDQTPYFFRTGDSGRTWQRIGRDLPGGHWARVVREDPVRRGLLYAGTEYAVHVSFDDGETWQPLQLNLPVTPVTDLKVQGTDLVASTSGRGLWVLDNLTPLRQMDAKVAAAPVHLFTPKEAIRIAGGRGGGSAADFVGTNPPAGAVIDFKVAAGGPVTIEVLDGSGTVVRRLSTERGEGVAAIRVNAGMNRVEWDLRRPDVRGITNVFSRGAMRGRFATPGHYTVRLSAAGQTLSAPLEVKADPRSAASAEVFAAQDRLLTRIETDIGELRLAVARVDGAREQIAAVSSRLSRATRKAAELVDGKLEAAKYLVVTKGTKRREITPPSRLYNHFSALYGNVNTSDADVTSSETAAFEMLHREWQDHKAAFDRLFDSDVAALNERLTQENLPAITLAQQ